MRTIGQTWSGLVVTAALVASPVVSPAAAQAKGPSPVASHATAGVVKSIGATTLVITRSGRHGGDMAFVLNPSTHREGAIETGFHVSVRYREEGQAHVATAVMGQEARKPQAAAGTTQGAR
jgi:hypothetical protein